jgi:Heterokaryon incompatibility protein (HET)
VLVPKCGALCREAVITGVSPSSQQRQPTPDPDFRYSRLNTGAGTAFIRLLDLEDGGKGGIIKCRLRHVDLNAEPVPKYEAVSYSWRKDILRGHINYVLSIAFPAHFSEFETEEQGVDTHLILCNDKALRIQRNLYDFLVRLRQKRRRLPLWIDAICIDQNESDKDAKNEKYQQLQMMGQIYESAEAVLVWLGECDNVSSSLPELLKALLSLRIDYEHFRTENDVLRLRKKPFPFRVVLQALGVDASSWRASLASIYKRLGPLKGLTRLVNRDYFQRAWVVQELVLAKDLKFFVGPMEIPSEHLLNGIRVASNWGQLPLMSINVRLDKAGFLTMPHVLQSRADRLEGRPWSFDDFLFLCRDRQASRPEDKIMSILGLVSGDMGSNLIDGVKTEDGILLGKLYANCAEILAGEAGWPYVLSLVATGAAESRDLPSWVPDFRVPLHPKPFWFYGCTHFEAATSVPAAFATSESKDAQDDGRSHPCLTLSTAYIDEIVQVGESHNELDLTQAIYVEGHMLDLFSKLGRYYGGTKELSMDALMRTLTADVFQRDENMHVEQLRRDFANWVELTFEGLGFTSTKMERRLAGLMARTENVSSVRDCSEINGTHLDISEAINAFVEVHDTSAYPIAEKFLGWPRRPRSPISSEEAPNASEDKGFGDFEDDDDDPLDQGFTVENLVKSMEKDFATISTAISNIYQHRRIFRTRERNLVGIGPRDIKRRDVVCLVAGAPTPFLFRRANIGTNGGDDGLDAGQLANVRLVGSAYLHGAMYRELGEDTKGSYKNVVVV